MQKNKHPQIEIPDKLYFKIGEVSKIAGVAPSVIRFWETEFTRINPKRTPSGQRLYRKHEIEHILTIKHLLYARKFTIQGAKRQLRTLDGKNRSHSALPRALDEIRSELKSIRNLLS